MLNAMMTVNAVSGLEKEQKRRRRRQKHSHSSSFSSSAGCMSKSLINQTCNDSDHEHECGMRGKVRYRKKFEKYTNLEKYREIQRRTQLLYGIKDFKRLMERSNETRLIYNKLNGLDDKAVQITQKNLEKDQE